MRVASGRRGRRVSRRRPRRRLRAGRDAVRIARRRGCRSRTGSPPLSQLNPQVSAGSVGRRRAVPRAAPEDRYPDAPRLADDLRRHLTDQPLAGVRNRSLAERWRKWRRRRPSTLRAAARWRSSPLLGAAVSRGRGRSRTTPRAGRARAVRRAAAAAERAASPQAVTDVRARAAIWSNGCRLRASCGGSCGDQLAIGPRDSSSSISFTSLPTRFACSTATESKLAWRGCTRWRAVRRVLVESETRSAVLSNDAGSAQPTSRTSQSSPPTSSAGSDDRREPLRTRRSPHRFRAAVAEPGARIHRAAMRLPSTAPLRPHRVGALTPWAARSSPPAICERREASWSAALRLDPAGRWPNFYYGLCAYRIGGIEDAVAAFSVCIGAARTSPATTTTAPSPYAALGARASRVARLRPRTGIGSAHAAAARTAACSTSRKSVTSRPSRT